MKKFKSIILGSLTSILILGSGIEINSYSNNFSRDNEYTLDEEIENKNDIENNINYYTQEIEEYESYKNNITGLINSLENLKENLNVTKNSLTEILNLWNYEIPEDKYESVVNWISGLESGNETLETFTFTGQDGTTTFEIEYSTGISNPYEYLYIDSIVSSNDFYTRIFDRIDRLTMSWSGTTFDSLIITIDNEYTEGYIMYSWNSWDDLSGLEENFFKTILFVLSFLPTDNNIVFINDQVESFDFLLNRFDFIVNSSINTIDTLISNNNIMLSKINENLVELYDQLDYWKHASIDDFVKNSKWVLPLIITLISLLVILLLITLLWFLNSKKNSSLSEQVKSILENSDGY